MHSGVQDGGGWKEINTTSDTLTAVIGRVVVEGHALTFGFGFAVCLKICLKFAQHLNHNSPSR